MKPAHRPGAEVLCAFDDIADPGTKVFTFGEESERFEIFVLRRGDHVVAYANDCPHARLPLDFVEGRFLNRDKTLILCSNHGALFRIPDGLCVAGPCAGASLRAVPVEVLAGEVVVKRGEG